MIVNRTMEDIMSSPVLITTIEFEGIKIEVFAEEVEGKGVQLSIKSTGTDTNYDINGLFIDLGNNGGDLRSAADVYDGRGLNSINMNGADSVTGEAFDGWDAIFALGRTGLGDGAVTNAAKDLNENVLLLANKTLADLQGAQIGLRLTSVDALDGGSLKLSGIAEVEEKKIDDIDWPEMNRDYSNIVFYLDGPEAGFGDLKKVKIDEINQKFRDGDFLTDPTIEEWLAANFPEYTLVAFSVKAGQQKFDWTHSGEGVFFLNDGDTIPDSQADANAAGITNEMLMANVSDEHTFLFSAIWGEFSA